MSVADGKKKGKPKKGFGGFILCVLLAIASVALMAVGVWKMLVVPPDVGGETPEPPVTGDTDPSPDTQNGAEPDVEAVNERKENYYTFLLLGKDTGGGENTDTMLLASYDVENGTLDVLSIPRDTMINVPWNIKKINAVYASARGLEGLKTEIGHLTSVVPDFYVTVEWEAIGEIVDALGGVWFDVPYRMDYDDPYQDLHIHQEKGYRLLSGDDAMQVIRWRKNNGQDYGIGDSGRQQVQQDFLKALAQQCLQLKNWTKVSAFVEIFFENVETDIPWNSLLWFAQQAMGLDAENITFHSLPGNDEGWYYTPSLGANLAYFFADPEGIVELVNAHFNPYTQDITVEDLQIVYKNEDASLGVTSGELADPKMAKPSVKPASAPRQDKDQDDAEPEEDEPEEDDEPTIPPESGEDAPPSGEGTEAGGEQPPEQNDEPTADGEQPPEQNDEPTVEGEDEPTLPDGPPEDETGENTEDTNA